MNVREHLKKADEDLYARFKTFENAAYQLLEFSQSGAHAQYTTHGHSHIQSVERNYDWLLSENDIEQLNAEEAFCLLCATYCHDIFMIPKEAGDEARARAAHATEADRELLRLKDKLSLTQSEAVFIGHIIRGHHVDSIDELPREDALGSKLVRLQLLGACLSLADICHADETRAPSIVAQYLSLEEESSAHWRRHMQISGISRLQNRIILSAITFSEEGELAVEKYGAEIQAQLERVKPYFSTELEPIAEVEVRLQKLDSELDQDLSFKTDTSAVLDLLVSGLYQNPDVFIRELIQNALDATYVESARRNKNGRPYKAKIAFTSLYDEEGKLIGVRVDDNGSGMDVSDVKDTLLWIGQSRKSNTSIQNLLKETNKELIANFGIGLLSCFRVASKVAISTQKGEDGRAFSVSLVGFGETISMNEEAKDSTGTTITVYFKDEFVDSEINEGIYSHCQMVNLAEIYIHSVELAPSSQKHLRKDMFSDAEDLGTRLEPRSPAAHAITIEGEGYFAFFETSGEINSTQPFQNNGKLDILNDGIFVCSEDTRDWLPKYLSYFNGTINFAAKAVDLPASRDSLVENSKLNDKQGDLSKRVRLILEQLAAQSRVGSRRNFCALALAHSYTTAPDSDKEMILQSAGALAVELYDGRQTSLKSLIGNNDVYLAYQEGSWVTELSKFDGVQLFHKKDSIAEMQAQLLFSSGRQVINCSRLDKVIVGSDRIIEKNIIAPYLQLKDVQVHDLLQDSIVLGELRSLKLPKDLRDKVGKRVKVMESGILPNKVGWDLGTEIWLNVTNPLVRNLYERLKIGSLSDTEVVVFLIVVDMVDNEFDSAMERAIEFLSKRKN